MHVRYDILYRIIKTIFIALITANIFSVCCCFIFYLTDTMKKQKCKHIESNHAKNEGEDGLNEQTEEFCANLDSNQAPMIEQLTDYVTQMVDKMNLTFSVSMDDLLHLKNENERLKKENSFLKRKRNKDGFSWNRTIDRTGTFDRNTIDRDQRDDDNGNKSADYDEMEKLRKENEELHELTKKLRENVGLLTNRISILHPKVKFLEMELEKYRDANMCNIDHYQDGIYDDDIYEAPHIYGGSRGTEHGMKT